MAMLWFVIGLLLIIGAGMLMTGLRRAALPGDRIDLDIPGDPPRRRPERVRPRLPPPAARASPPASARGVRSAAARGRR